MRRDVEERHDARQEVRLFRILIQLPPICRINIIFWYFYRIRIGSPMCQEVRLHPASKSNYFLVQMHYAAPIADHWRVFWEMIAELEVRRDVEERHDARQEVRLHPTSKFNHFLVHMQNSKYFLEQMHYFQAQFRRFPGTIPPLSQLIVLIASRIYHEYASGDLRSVFE